MPRDGLGGPATMTPELREDMTQYQSICESAADRWSKIPGSAIRGFSQHRTVDFLKGIEDPTVRGRVALICENVYRWLTQEVDESVRTVHVGSFEKFIFPLLRAVYANLVAADLVTVQPLTAPNGTVFFMDILYGTRKGRIQRGGRMFDVRRGPATDIHYTDEIVEEEAHGAGNAVQTVFGGTLDWRPIRPGTVKIKDGTWQVVDDGNGVLGGDGTGTINYQSGVYNMTWTTAPTAGATITADYEFDGEGQSPPEIELVMTSSPVTARDFRLKYLVSVQSQQNFKAYFGADADVELTAYMANEIQREINYRIIRHLEQIASATAAPVQWDRTPPLNVPWIWHKQSLYDALIQTSNAIYTATQRRGGNKIVAGIGVCDVLETLDKFKSSGGGEQTDAGMRKIGKVGDFDVYKDPTMPNRNRFLMAFKGSNWLDTGYIHAPFLGLFVTPVITLDDMVSRKAMMQRAGQKVVNPYMYCLGEVVQSGGAFGP